MSENSVVGDGAGASKLTKAEQFGVPIVPADDFDRLLARIEELTSEPPRP